MINLFSFKGLLFASIGFFLAAAPAKAAIIVQSFGPGGTTAPQTIAPLDTVIGAKTTALDENFLEEDYRALTSSNDTFRFVRHFNSSTDEVCFYWFRADEDPTAFAINEYWNDVYWWVGSVEVDPCRFVDGAEDGSNNFVLLYNIDLNLLVGVLQYELNSANSIDYPGRLLAYAVDPNGLTFAEGVNAIQQAIPEPSTVALTALALLGGLFKLRRRN